MIEAASTLFYEEGIRAVSADRIIAEVGTTKATFYRHFPSKDDLVLAYLDHQALAERAEMAAAVGPDDPAEALGNVVAILSDAACTPGFRGCPFMNAAAEYPDADHRVRVAVAEHRAWWRQFLEDLSVRLGVPREAAENQVAAQLLIMRDGVLYSSYVDPTSGLNAQLSAGVRSLLSPWLTLPASWGDRDIAANDSQKATDG